MVKRFFLSWAIALRKSNGASVGKMVDGLKMFPIFISLYLYISLFHTTIPKSIGGAKEGLQNTKSQGCSVIIYQRQPEMVLKTPLLSIAPFLPSKWNLPSSLSHQKGHQGFQGKSGPWFHPAKLCNAGMAICAMDGHGHLNAAVLLNMKTCFGPLGNWTW